MAPELRPVLQTCPHCRREVQVCVTTHYGQHAKACQGYVHKSDGKHFCNPARPLCESGHLTYVAETPVTVVK